ncbi:MAG TPA: bifunctional diaminohydroxyphosphoribosylaminopyrimidine deaminase/5-amino-6-(5-phosphoribosylamino)uracil reductase RibD [Hyphomicrobium sp.]|nr:bifunctional diaminohydroxyphosphoribosylaminopyrimidine deaminase/5-amino-6-(5-phosphoribosylamino)uracil reductase RibD [Hyphomicrobium sp.]
MDANPPTAFDCQMMAVALRMAERGLGQTSPNPSVGAVIANTETGELIARATTARGGRPHAETQAIAIAGARAQGATIYVTLEPCSHHGHTGPCAEAIIASGLNRAVVAIEDPDPRVAGRGLDILRAAGLDVIRGVGADAARWITRGHIVRITERRPLVTLKMALDSDGEVPRGDGKTPKFITGENARAHGHLLRARNDAILIGAGTMRDDNPELTCRLPGLADRSPARIVLSRDAIAWSSSRMMQSAVDAPIVFVTGEATAVVDKAPGIDHAKVPVVGGQLWLPAVMEALVARGITQLLVEGGPTMWRAFAAASLVDEIVLYMAPANARGRADEAQARVALQRRLGALPIALIDQRTLDPDTMWRFRRITHKEGL